MTWEQAAADVREFLADPAAIPLEGSQWLMPWEIDEADRRKAGLVASSAPALPGAWKAELDALDH